MDTLTCMDGRAGSSGEAVCSTSGRPPLGKAGFEASLELACDSPVWRHVSSNDSDCDTVSEALFGEPPAKAAKLQASEPPPDSAAGLRAVEEVLAAYSAVPLPAGETLESHAQMLIQNYSLEETSFYICDLGMTQRLYTAWVEAMPRVVPFYAVKCNTNLALMATLAAMGAGFDCATEAEIEAVLSLGVPVDRIIYAHPCKPPSQIRYSAAKGVNLTTFDSESELHKLAQWHPGTQALLRIRADDTSARCQLGNKYGAEPEEVPGLLRAARDLNIAVVGVSFHVGSGATNPAAFSRAIELAREVFDAGAALGFRMDLLDLGGGFCGGNFDAAGRVDLGGVPAAVNAALDAHFPPSAGVRVMAEPGRYFAEATAAFVCCINGHRVRRDAAGAVTDMSYFLSDGVYGSFNCMVYDHAVPTARALRSPNLPAVAPEAERLCRSVLFGPTCDGLDTVLRDIELPLLRNGDFVFFPRMGAYGIAGACNFNGFNVTGVPFFYVYS